MSTLYSIDINFIAFLVALCVIVGLFLRNKNSITGERLHLFYISGILVVILVCIVSFFCVNKDKDGILFNYLSFASTLSSIILSVLAIIITVLSNNSMDNLKKAIDSVKELPEDIKKSMEKPLGAINSSTDKLQEMVQETKNAQTVNNENTQAILKEIEKHLSSHDYKLEQVTAQLSAQNNDNLSKQNTESSDEIKLNDIQVKAFIDTLPNAFIYLAGAVDYLIEHHNGKYVSLKEIGRLTGADDNSMPGAYLYLYSACLSLSALNLISFDRKGDMNEIVFTSISETLKTAYVPRFNEFDDCKGFITAIDEYMNGDNDNLKTGEEK